MVKQAKAEEIKVTAEVCPHHFSLCSEDITGNDGNFKMNPPLRAREDMEALIKGLSEDIMDVISTDHAPHSAEEKEKDLNHAPFGIVGLETSVALTITNLVKKGFITPLQMAAKMSYNPARILGINKGTLDEGAIADVTIINPDKEYVIDKDTFVSKGKNTPFDGYKVSGEVTCTILNGEIVYKNN
jgi:dihydroorotase